jgi:hypothetical protein
MTWTRFSAPTGCRVREHQDMQSPEEHGVHVQETGCDDPGGLGVQELPPARTRTPRCRIDAGRTQDLPYGGGRDCHAGLCEFAVDPAVSPQRILLRQADDKPGDARDRRRAPWLSPLAGVVLLRRQPAVLGQQRRWRHGEDFSPAPARDKPRQRGEPGPAGRLIPHPACPRSTAFSRRSISSSASFARSLRKTRTARPSTRHVSR